MDFTDLVNLVGRYIPKLLLIALIVAVIFFLVG